jgi:hypothetical protein
MMWVTAKQPTLFLKITNLHHASSHITIPQDLHYGKDLNDPAFLNVWRQQKKNHNIFFMLFQFQFTWEFWDFHSHVIENSGLLECDAASMGKEVPMFQENPGNDSANITSQKSTILVKMLVQTQLNQDRMPQLAPS